MELLHETQKSPFAEWDLLHETKKSPFMELLHETKKTISQSYCAIWGQPFNLSMDDDSVHLSAAHEHSDKQAD